MQRQTLSSLLIAAVVGLAACDRPPASPIAPATVGIDSTTQATVTATVTQALSQTAVSGSALTPSMPSPPVFSYPCPNGGTIVTTYSPPVLIDGSVVGSFTMTSRTEFNDCRSQNVTMRGDPALVHSSKFETAGPPGSPTSMTATMQTIGAILTISNGVESRVRYDCMSVLVMETGSAMVPAQITINSTGTVTWESPLGTVARTTSCGPTPR